MAATGGSLSPRSYALTNQRPRDSFVGASRINDYEILNKLGEGTFGEVYGARSRRCSRLVAVKKIIMHNEKDGFPITALREIKLLKLLDHRNVLKLEDMAIEHPHSKSNRKRPSMYMVTPYMDHDLSGLLDNASVRFTIPQIKCYTLQLLEGLRYLHEHNILHRDMKAANLLIDNKGILRIADFGLARHYEGPVPRPGCGGGEGVNEYTSLVVTRWYRPPELLMYLKRYTTAIDMWGVGCVFGEMLTGGPILTGQSDGHQLELIFDLVGTPDDQTMPGWRKLPGSAALRVQRRAGNLRRRFAQYGPGAVSLLLDLLKLDWKSRVNASDALNHNYFRQPPLAANPADLPTFEESHELDRRKLRDRKAALPPAPKGGTVGVGKRGGPGAVPAGGYKPGETGGRAGGGGRANSRPIMMGRNGHADDRRPAWQRGESSLPPRPPPVEKINGWDKIIDHERYHRDRDRDRDRDRAARGGVACVPGVPGGGRSDKETCHANYQSYQARDDGRRRDDRDRVNKKISGLGDRSRSTRTRSRSRSPTAYDHF